MDQRGGVNVRLVTLQDHVCVPLQQVKCIFHCHSQKCKAIRKAWSWKWLFGLFLAKILPSYCPHVCIHGLDLLHPFFILSGTGWLNLMGSSRNHAYIRFQDEASTERTSVETWCFDWLSSEKGNTEAALSDISYGSHSSSSLRRAIRWHPVIRTMPRSLPSWHNPRSPVKDHGLFPELKVKGVKQDRGSMDTISNCNK